jgi:hypothetical protein
MKVICKDSINYLKEQSEVSSIITSLPDKEEVGMSLEEWKNWYMDTVRLIFDKINKNSYAIFYQTNRKYKGTIKEKE